MVDFDFIKKEIPSVLFFFTRLEVFLESSSGHCPHVGLFVPQDCWAFRLVLISLYPSIRYSLIAYHLEMTAKEYRDSDIRSNKIETSLSSSGKSTYKDFEIVVPKPPIVFKNSFVFNPFSFSLRVLPFRVKAFEIYT